MNPGSMNHGSMMHGSMNHGSMNHGSMNHGSMNHGSMNPGSWIQDPGAMTIQKIQKIGNGQEKDKYPTKSDENLPIWSKTGQENLSRRVPDPKNARGVVKNEGLQVAVTSGVKGGVGDVY